MKEYRVEIVSILSLAYMNARSKMTDSSNKVTQRASMGITVCLKTAKNSVVRRKKLTVKNFSSYDLPF